ncbi:MAG: rhomboid family intramembrane serine protease [Actinomycetota bacterium]|nr:rhomboid family intramembrane serine protease [Actinomycetota bacterium]
MSIPHDQHGTQAGLPACVRHPDRPTGLTCTRCGLPACPECLVDASVGYQCVDCVRQGQRTTRRPTTVAGAEVAEKPLLVPVLIAVNAVFFVITAVQAQSPFNNDLSSLFRALSAYTPSIVDGQFWRPVTSAFLHFGPIHLLVNMVALWFMRDLELMLGRLRYALVYGLSLLGGSAASFVFGDISGQGAGASGAVYGLLGGLIVAVIRLKLDKHVLMTVVGVLAVNLALSITIENISLLAHLGGLVVGALLTFGMVYAPADKRTLWQSTAVIVVTVAILGLFVVRTVELGSDVFCTDATALECYETATLGTSGT